MWGKLGNKLTIYRDWLYDWEKIYQLIIGYDKFSEKDFENLKIITTSLIFTLIPLHNNEKCIKYYKLLFSWIIILMPTHKSSDYKFSATKT